MKTKKLSPQALVPTAQHAFVRRLRMLIAFSGRSIRELFSPGSRPSRAQVHTYLAGTHLPRLDTLDCLAGMLGVCTTHFMEDIFPGEVCPFCAYRLPIEKEARP